MDNLQWFKFSPADWMMGRIQRQPAQVQVDFLRICCQYWKNEGNYSIEDAQLEAVDSYEALVKFKIIKEINNNIKIEFLDEQLDDVESKRLQASKAGKRSAEARRRKSESNGRSTGVQQPPNEHSTESNRVEKSREDEEEDLLKPTEFDEFWKLYGKNIGYVPCQRKWAEIDAKEYAKILEHVPKFVKASGDFLKNPENYLNDRCWMDKDLPNYTKKEETKKPIETYKPNLIFKK